MLKRHALHALVPAALAAGLLSSCSEPRAAEHPPTAPDSAAVAGDTAKTATTTPAAKRHHRHVLVVDRTAPLTPVAPEEIGRESNPACLQLIAAEERLRIAQVRYQDALRHFEARAQSREDASATTGSPTTAQVATGYPAAEYREFVTASMAVRSLRGLCSDHH